MNATFGGLSPSETARDEAEPEGKSLARRGLDALLERYPAAQIEEIDGQTGRRGLAPLGLGFFKTPPGPWVRVMLDEKEFAIWKETGAVYRTKRGAVEEEPVLTICKHERRVPAAMPGYDLCTVCWSLISKEDCCDKT